MAMSVLEVYEFICNEIVDSDLTYLEVVARLGKLNEVDLQNVNQLVTILLSVFENARDLHYKEGAEDFKNFLKEKIDNENPTDDA